jgi:dolichyl-phosphate-mannose--protein O-mannosyl transferase
LQSFKAVLKKLYHWQYIWLCLIVLTTLVLHFVIITRPTSLILDEQHYIKEARTVISEQRFVFKEHPPLAKLFLVAGEFIFSGFKSPVDDAGTTLHYINDSDPVLSVSDASLFSEEKAIKIDEEQMRVLYIDAENNQITVERGYSGTSASSHTAGRPIYIFHDNPWCWRFFPVAFGTGCIILFYFICRRLDMSNRAASIAPSCWPSRT